MGDVTWYTDHKALESLRTTLADSARRARSREFLEGFPFKVAYRKGKDMHVDGMTRHSSWDDSTGSIDPLLDPDRFISVPKATISRLYLPPLDFVRKIRGIMGDAGGHGDTLTAGSGSRTNARLCISRCASASHHTTTPLSLGSGPTEKQVFVHRSFADPSPKSGEGFLDSFRVSEFVGTEEV
jgi:hypothetical protein